MPRTRALLASVFLFAVMGAAQTGTINTIAGTDPFYRIQIGFALNAPLGGTEAVAVDRSAGVMYLADYQNNVVVKVDSGGQLLVVVGTGKCGFSGDGGPSPQAQLCSPIGLAFDSSNNFLYIADSGNHRIRRLAFNTGIITTVAGTGTPGFSGDTGNGTNAMLSSPSVLAVNSQGVLFIADQGNGRIRRLANGIITTVAGNGVFGFSGDGGPATSASFGQEIQGITTDLFGNIYFSDSLNHRIRAFQVGSTINTYIGTGVAGFSGDGGPAASARINYPAGLTMDTPQNNLLIADAGNNRIRSVGQNNFITTVGGNGLASFSGDGGPALNAAFYFPVGIATDASNNFFISDSGNGRARKMQAGGNIDTVAGNGEYRFFGDNGPATGALFAYVASVVTDSTGNVYAADGDNHRIRKFTPGGIITTIAGTGLPGFSGDNGPATSAMLNIPYGLAFDSSGNLLIADYGNNRIRKVTPAGTISTVAGNGVATFSGDGGQATAASLYQPRSVSVDQGGNILIADTGNYRIRMVTPGGIISTAAGNGQNSFSGDNGPATSAAVGFPLSVAGAGAGVFYFANGARIRRVSGGTITTFAGNGSFGCCSGDGGQATAVPVPAQSVSVDSAGSVVACTSQQVRKITSAGILSTLAGTGTAGFGGDGGPALSATMQCSSAVFDSQGSLIIGETYKPRVRKVTFGASPTVTVTPPSLNFTMVAGVANPAPQKLTLNSSQPGTPWTGRASTTTGGGWLFGAPGGGTLPDTATVFVGGLSLSPGTYQGSITIQTPGASPASTTIPVTLTVTQSAAPSLGVGPDLLKFEAVAGSTNLSPQTVLVGTKGGNMLVFTATARTVNGGPWLSVPGGSSTAFSDGPTSVPVSVNATGLPAGAYTGSIQISSSTTGESMSVGVRLLLTPSAPAILLSQSGLLFTAVEGSNVTFSQSVGIVNSGSGTLSWDTAVSAGNNIVTISPASGSNVAGAAPQPITISANFSALKAGVYSGFITISAPGASNSPQHVGVVVNILPATQKQPVHVQPAGMLLVASGTPAATQTFRASFPSGGVSTTVSLQTLDGGNWLSANQTSFSGDTTVTLSALRGTLAPSVYRGVVTLVFGNGSPAQDVRVFMIVPPASEASPQSKGSPVAAGCTPTKLVGVMSKLGSNFSSQVGWPVNLEAQVADDCGNPVSTATVVAAFSNGDPSLQLNPLGNGFYSVTWNPAHSTAASTTVTVQATQAPLASVTLSVPGQVGANAFTPPAIGTGGVVSAASFEPGAEVVPGGIIAVFGSNMASAPTFASFPLPTTLGGVKLTIGGKDAPIFFTNNTQVNAQVPVDLPPNSRTQAVLRVTPAGSTQEQVAVPEPIALGAAHPGIFLAGATQGVIVNPAGAVLDGSNRATAGDIIIIYATGLGLTDQNVGTGQPSPTPPANVKIPVTVSIGGQNATVLFAGLTPTLVGLYQLNVQVPTGVTPGAAVPVVLTQNGVPSTAATMGIR